MNKNFNTLFVTMFGLGKFRKFLVLLGHFTVIILYVLFHTLNLSSNIILIGLIIILFSFFAVAKHIKDTKTKIKSNIR